MPLCDGGRFRVGSVMRVGPSASGHTAAVATPGIAMDRRRAGLLWLLATVSGGWALTFIRGRIYVPGDAAATAGAIAANALLFRCAIVSALVSQLAMLFLALEFFRVFAPVERVLARVLLVSMVVATGLAVANQLPNLVALLLVDGEPQLQAFTAEQRASVVLLLLRVQNGAGQGLLEIFWTPFYVALGLLAWRTRVLPRVLAVLLVVMGIGFAVNILDKLLVPTFAPVALTRMAMVFGALGAIPTMLWLLVRGLTPPVRAERVI